MVTRLEAIEEEIRKLSPEELVELRRRLDRSIEKIDNPVVPQSRKYTFEDIRREIFPTPPRHHTLEELRDGIEDEIREKHGRR